MPSGDYAAIGGGALKLKGAKVQKTKKKKRKDKSDLEKNLSGGETSEVVKTNTETTPADAQDAHPSQRNSNNDDDDDEEAPELRKTEAERRYEEVKRKRVRPVQTLIGGGVYCKTSVSRMYDYHEQESQCTDIVGAPFSSALERNQKLQKLAESSTSRPELLKTHKERVEELNTYLSKLSEHHDMPKIGPG